MTPSVSPRDVADWGNRAGFTLPESALVPLAAYLDLLMQWNKVMNLVGTRSAEETFFTLVVDSLHLARFLTEKVALAAAPSCWDLGSGAGLPGLPLRMLWTEGEYWLVESREKRALFLSTAPARHPLSGTRVYRGRAESFMAGPPSRQADLVVSRAFMPWPDVLRLVRANLKPEGTVILLLREELPTLPEWGQAAAHWEITSSQSYAVGGKQRSFWALRAR